MPDYMYMLESRLSAEQRAAMMRVQELAAAASANVYLTGGAVRDLISGAPIRDLDFTIEGNPARLVRELEKGGAQIVFEDERLRHVEMIFAGDCDGSLSAARDNVYARPGTTPEIRWSTIMEDLRCRDFSLNAIANLAGFCSTPPMGFPTLGTAKSARFRFTVSRISPCASFARCVSPRAWGSSWRPGRPSGSHWHSTVICSMKSRRKMRAPNCAPWRAKTSPRLS